MSYAGRQAVATEYEPKIKGVKTMGAEQHNRTECRYVKRSEMRNVSGKDRKMFYWIRTCQCGNKADHSDLLDVHPENLDKTDGVEVHLKEDCQWVEPEMGEKLGDFPADFFRNLERRCVCLQYVSVQ